MNTERRSGITSRQIMNAPKGSVFVWCTGDLRYPTELARHLQRTDLKIIGPGSLQFQEGGRRHIVTDHACMLSTRDRNFIAAINFHAEQLK